MRTLGNSPLNLLLAIVSIAASILSASSYADFEEGL